MIGDLFALVLAALFAYYLITKHLLSRKCRVWTVLNNVASKPHSSEDLGVEDDSDFGRAVKFVRCGKFRLQDASVIVILYYLPFRSLPFMDFSNKQRLVMLILKILEPLIS